MVPTTPTDPHVIALAALAATLTDQRRAQRFLELTGIGTDELRHRAHESGLLVALIAFLEAHEPDLISVSELVGIEPAKLTAVRLELEADS
jgi:hypothetical protein